MKWGPGDAYLTRGARSQPKALRRALESLQMCHWRSRGNEICGTVFFRGMHCCAWKVGHHAGRIFAMREKAREAIE